jgi:hypothetical protein
MVHLVRKIQGTWNENDMQMDIKFLGQKDFSKCSVTVGVRILAFKNGCIRGCNDIKLADSQKTSLSSHLLDA